MGRGGGMEIFDTSGHPLTGVGLQLPPRSKSLEIPNLGPAGQMPAGCLAIDVLHLLAGNDVAIGNPVVVDPKINLIVTAGRDMTDGELERVEVIVRRGVIAAGYIGFIRVRANGIADFNPDTEG